MPPALSPSCCRRSLLFATLGLSWLLMASPAPVFAQQGKSLAVVPRSGALANQTVYTNSYAVIIGIDYDTFPQDLQLDRALNDADDLKSLLVASYGFLPDNITLLKGKNATRRNIEKALAKMSSDNVQPTDRVLVYFSGHGQTIKTNDGGDMGFLIPADAQIDLKHPTDREQYLSDCLPMNRIWEFLEASPARHRLLIADACFGGLLIRGKALNHENPNGETLKGYLAIPALQAITAGGKGEEALILPRLRNSAFTSKLLETLRQAAATPGDVVTTSELGAALKNSVSNLVSDETKGKFKQTPQVGSRGTEGEFLFVSAGNSAAPPPVPAVVPPTLPEVSGGSAVVVNTRARLKVTTNAPGAVVSVDGQPISGGEYVVNLLDEPNKSIQVKVTAPGFEGQIVNALVERGKVLPLSVTLERSTVLPPAFNPPVTPVRPVTPGPSLSRGTTVNPKDGAEMILIPSGAFLMGDSDRTDNPRRSVTLSAYYIYKNLVTVGMYEKFCRETGKAMPDAPSFSSGWSKKDHPIVRVSWEDAKAYCAWAGAGLPSEAQWERAARGTDGRKFPWGNEFDLSKLWASKAAAGDAGGTTRVGSFVSGASPDGVLDMAGNVFQWCEDWYDEGFPASSLGTQSDPVNDSVGAKTSKVLRGGSWNVVNADNADFFRSAYRNGIDPSFRVNDIIGFRCVSSGR